MVRATSVKFLMLDSDVIQELHNFLALRMTRMLVCTAPFEDLGLYLFEHFFNIFSASVDEHIQVAGAEVFHKLEK